MSPFRLYERNIQSNILSKKDATISFAGNLENRLTGPHDEKVIDILENNPTQNKINASYDDVINVIKKWIIGNNHKIQNLILQAMESIDAFKNLFTSLKKVQTHIQSHKMLAQVGGASQRIKIIIEKLEDENEARPSEETFTYILFFDRIASDLQTLAYHWIKEMCEKVHSSAAQLFSSDYSGNDFSMYVPEFIHQKGLYKILFDAAELYTKPMGFLNPDNTINMNKVKGFLEKEGKPLFEMKVFNRRTGVR